MPPASVRTEVNRPPVLTLWAEVVAHRLGIARDEALTKLCVVAGLNAYAKGKLLGHYQPHPKTVEEERKRLERGKARQVDLLYRAASVKRGPAGLRALSKDKLVAPESVQRRLELKFGKPLPAAEAAMNVLAKSLPSDELASRAGA